jgi:hypothetical protein
MNIEIDAHLALCIMKWPLIEDSCGLGGGGKPLNSVVCYSSGQVGVYKQFGPWSPSSDIKDAMEALSTAKVGWQLSTQYGPGSEIPAYLCRLKGHIDFIEGWGTSPAEAIALALDRQLFDNGSHDAIPSPARSVPMRPSRSAQPA